MHIHTNKVVNYQHQIIGKHANQLAKSSGTLKASIKASRHTRTTTNTTPAQTPQKNPYKTLKSLITHERSTRSTQIDTAT